MKVPVFGATPSVKIYYGLSRKPNWCIHKYSASYFQIRKRLYPSKMDKPSILYSIATSLDTYIFIGVFALAVWLFFKNKRHRKDVSFASISGPLFSRPMGKRRVAKKGGEGKFEGRCREIFQKLLGVPFTTVRTS